MSNDSTILTREALYEQVWSTPTTTLARRYGLSDVGFAKLCKRHQVPRPPRGYWAKLAQGQVLPRPPLPPADELTPDLVLLPATAADNASTPAAIDPEVAAALKAEASAEPLVVRGDLRHAHPLVAETLRERREEDQWWKARPSPYAEPPLWRKLNVAASSEDNYRRGLRVMDAIVRALESRGHAVTIKPHRHRPQTLITVLGKTFELRIYEPARQVPRVPKTGEERHRLRYEEQPSGNLLLQLRSVGGTIHGQWRDGKRRKLEHAIGDFIPAVLRQVDVERAWDAARVREAARERETEQRCQEEAEQRRRAEEERQREREEVRALLREVKHWRTALDIRGYLEAIRAKIAELGMVVRPGSPIDKSIVWAAEVADRYDPIRPPPDLPPVVRWHGPPW